MNILAIESSCDETAAAVVKDGRTVLSNCVASQIEMHTIYGGVVPEIASRKHVEAVTGLADQALEQAGMTRGDLDAIAVTYAPGLIGAVLVGVNFAKGASMALDLPLIPVHHVRGHIAANYLTHPDLEPPFVCLCVSGGTTAIVDVKSYTEMEVLGGTREDAGSALTRWPGCWISVTLAAAPWTAWLRVEMTAGTSCPAPMWLAMSWICPSPA